MYSILLALAVATTPTLDPQAAPPAAPADIVRSPGTVVQFGDGRTAEMYSGRRASSPEDKRDWLTLRLGEVGLIVVSDDGKSEILSVDKFGGVYINGDLYVKGEKVGAASATASVATSAPAPAGIGWMQLVLVALATAVLSVLVSTNISKHQAR